MPEAWIPSSFGVQAEGTTTAKVHSSLQSQGFGSKEYKDAQSFKRLVSPFPDPLEHDIHFVLF